MGGNNRQRKSSSFMSVFNIFKSNNSRHRGNNNSSSNYNGGYYYYEEGAKAGTKVWPSDEDRGRWGVADPVIDMKASAFIAKYKKRISDSELHCHAAHPTENLIKMGGKKRQRKSSLMSLSSFVLSLFKSNKGRGGVGQCEVCESSWRKVWPSDEDRGSWGVAEPGIDKKADAFIAHRRSRTFSEPSTTP
ncbi:hypothetical protein PIB30_045181 [Stylosanthes scabra]|uniref:Uncharacterized protein n=1 Tax=Stylosanthes scabra TaxID=79078 RepID=A0ABU6YGP5_9FABA|nr:hypothetical protein [Stylosanthes scabra]